ncbi:hypothetical protein GCM10020358_21090 [Amorphoplanes nipponensis]|uniref:RDD domain-containing protein n=1 Tax=Actinoplanes nipponensis TaxID=135950 RepID=A0A919JHA6_9ACTN|nr:RDD family protein [Actinoplanes nipponensis]GIE49360.1 hypothetical protein Ani05nite_28940 [Actinoplanes nipponensis]
MTQANDDASAVTGPPTSGPVHAPVPPQAGGPPAYPPPHYGPPQQHGWRPPPVPLAPDGRPLADFGTRLLAYLIDGAILSGIALVVFIPVLSVLLLTAVPDDFDAATGPETVFTDLFLPFLLIELGFVLLLLAGYYVYYVEMMYRSGQTVGKRLMKVRVVPIEPGATLTRGMAAKRYLVEFVVGMLVPLFSYLDGFWQLWDKPFQQTLHDKIARTVVVKVAP